MYIASYHSTLLGHDQDRGLFHSHSCNGVDREALIRIDANQSRNRIVSGPLSGFELISIDSGEIALAKDAEFLCAEPGHRIATRKVRSAWESFRLVPEEDVNAPRHRSPQEEQTRLLYRIEHLRTVGRPVKLFFGAGTVPRAGFLNIDRAVGSPAFSATHFEDYFIFPFADTAWNIPDHCVDYIFHEDFIEHIDQTSQFQFLAEALRVMKPGTWHRVNTPNLIWTMKVRSDFIRGFNGVYTGERQWEHVAIFSPSSLEEAAKLVGYREVVFTTRDHGLSPHAEPDFRPMSDRDSILGNIYADLLK